MWRSGSQVCIPSSTFCSCSLSMNLAMERTPNVATLLPCVTSALHSSVIRWQQLLPSILDSHSFHTSWRRHAEVTCMIRATVYKPSFISGGHENWTPPQYQVKCATQLLLFCCAAFNCRNALVHVFRILDTLHEHFATGGHPVIITIHRPRWRLTYKR